MVIFDRFKNAWNAFRGRHPTESYYEYGSGGDPRSTRTFLKGGVSRSIVNTIYTRIAVDVSSINFNHARLDDDNKYKETIYDSLNYILSMSANLDQSGTEFIKDIVITMLSEGVACVVPYETDKDPYLTDSYRVKEARVGTITQWFPKHVKVSLYDAEIGQKREIVLEKRICVIITNPFFETMNGENSTLKRLIRTLNQLDRFNDGNDVQKLNLLIRLPYATSKRIKKDQAESRRTELESQLTNSKLGIGYIDASENVIQLNRPIENNLWEQAKDLLIELYNRLGISEKIFNGTASEQELVNYQNNVIEPIVKAITENMTRKWISLTGQSQKQAVVAFYNGFRSVPISVLAELSDKLTRNEILSSNEVRSIIGFKPVDDPNADKLINSNLNHPEEKARVKNKNIPEDLRKRLSDKM